MQSDLLELKNLGATTVNWLHIIGVNSYQQLAELGAAGAYVQIKSRGIKVSKVALYAMHGALTDTHWTELSEETKNELLELAERQSNAADCV